MAADKTANYHETTDNDATANDYNNKGNNSSDTAAVDELVFVDRGILEGPGIYVSHTWQLDASKQP